MSSNNPIAPKERVNITYRTNVNGQKEQVELPMKILVVGDVTGRRAEKSLSEPERVPININKNNFNEVMEHHELKAQIVVPDRLVPERGTMSVELEFKTLKDFEPAGIAKQVPDLKDLLELRNALVAVRGPMGNQKTLRERIQEILKDRESRERLMRELGLDPKED